MSLPVVTFLMRAHTLLFESLLRCGTIRSDEETSTQYALRQRRRHRFDVIGLATVPT